MDRVADTSGNLLMHPDDLVLPDFVEHGPDFSPSPEPVPRDTVNPDPREGALSVPAHYADSGMVYRQFGPLPDQDTFGIGRPGVEDSNFVLDGLSSFAENVKIGEEDDTDGDDDDCSSSMDLTANTTSASTTPSPRTPTKKMKKADRSRTLISERRRRGRMKEKLHALRALVPNITKMDKASIVGDAVFYVQDLQMQAKKLKSEIADLEDSLAGPEKYHQGQPENCLNNIHHATRSTSPVPRRILQMDVFQVEERGFLVRVVSNRGLGVAVSLYKAVESLTSFIIRGSNLASSSSSDRFILTFTMNLKEDQPDMRLPNLRRWITESLLNQGFKLIRAA